MKPASSTMHVCLKSLGLGYRKLGGGLSAREKKEREEEKGVTVATFCSGRDWDTRLDSQGS